MKTVSLGVVGFLHFSIRDRLHLADSNSLGLWQARGEEETEL